MVEMTFEQAARKFAYNAIIGNGGRPTAGITSGDLIAVGKWMVVVDDGGPDEPIWHRVTPSWPRAAPMMAAAAGAGALLGLMLVHALNLMDSTLQAARTYGRSPGCPASHWCQSCRAGNCALLRSRNSCPAFPFPLRRANPRRSGRSLVGSGAAENRGHHSGPALGGENGVSAVACPIGRPERREGVADRLRFAATIA